MAKLIRDGYLKTIDDSELELLSDTEVLPYALEKINEEVQELKDSNFEDIYEFVDVVDVLMKVLELKGFTLEEFNAARDIKNSKKGGFTKNVLLTEEEVEVD